MARSQKADTRLWVWEGSLVHDVIPVIEGLGHRRSRKIGRFSTIAFVRDPKGGAHSTNFNFYEGQVQHLVSHDPCADRFRFTETRKTHNGSGEAIERVEVDIYVSKGRDRAWTIVQL